MNLNSLNQQQLEAVTSYGGIIRILAGPGSGKTRVITYHLAHLIQEGVKPENILAVTFTKKAAQEMKDRITALLNGCGKPNSNLNIGTFHSICYRILKAEYASLKPGMKDFSVLDESGQRSLIRKVASMEGEKPPLGLKELVMAISRAKNELISPKRFVTRVKDIYDSVNLRRSLQKIYQAYEQEKERCGQLDFDDLLTKTWELFQNYPQIRQKYQQQFIHILLDEGQDTNLAQFEIIKQLLPPQNNLMIVGDDAQSIYSFRGAKPEYLIDFEQVFPKVQTIKLEQNYRSTKRIIDLSNQLIQCNQIRTDKRLWTQRDDGALVEVISSDNQDDEADRITSQVKALTRQGITFSDIAVLYRTNGQSRSLEDGCIQNRIPYIVIGTLGFYHRREIKDMVAYLQLIQNPGHDEAIRRIYNVPNRFLGKAFLSQLETIAGKKKTSLFEQLDASFSKSYMEESAIALKRTIQGFQRYYSQTNNLSGLMPFIRKALDYDAYILQDEEISPDNSRIQNLNELEIAASRFQDLSSFLFYVDQVQKRSQQNQDGQNKVHLMTIHKAKGLEFKVIFVAGCSEGLLPHFKDMDNLEEARRLMYVAVTRAKDKLYLSWLKNYQDKALNPSSFLKEMGFEISSQESESSNLKVEGSYMLEDSNAVEPETKDAQLEVRP